MTALSHSMSPDIHAAYARVSCLLYLQFIPDRDYSVKAVASTFWLPRQSYLPSSNNTINLNTMSMIGASLNIVSSLKLNCIGLE